MKAEARSLQKGTISDKIIPYELATGEILNMYKARQYICFLLFLCIPSYLSATAAHKVCLNMIVKNEVHVIERCLESVLPLIDYWVIVDTGSTDGTQDAIRNFMKKNGVTGELHEHPWKNFGFNRNQALELALGKSEYIFFIDADEYLVYERDFKLPPLVKDRYYITVSHSGTLYGKLQLVKSTLKWNWVGVLHEYLSSQEASSTATLEGITTVYTSEGARSKDPLKYKNDAAILENALLEEPNNERYHFYLAQSYRDAKEYEKAIGFYQKRASMGGWDQEVFYSLLQIALIKEELEYPNEEVIENYFQAFTFRPSRAEPLYRIANLYRRIKDFEKGYKVASIASIIPYPDDLLFVEGWIYEYGIELEQSACAYWIGNYKECQKLALRILAKPNLPEEIKDCAKRNLEYANAKLIEAEIFSIAN